LREREEIGWRGREREGDEKGQKEMEGLGEVQERKVREKE